MVIGRFDRAGIAVIGAGYWGPNLIRNFQSLPECEVKWVCDKKPGRLQFIRERFPTIPLTDDYGAVLGDPSVEAVVLATPVSSHFDLAIAALWAGKHVFVEKPLAGNTVDAEEIVRVSKEVGRSVAVGHIFVHNPAVAKMRELIDSGSIGRLCYAESSRVNLGPPASEVNVIWDLAVHDISILLYLWGKQPAEVIAYGGRFLQPDLVDAAFLHLRFDDGTMAQHHVSWMSPERVRRMFVAGTCGSLVFDDTLAEGKLRQVDQGVDSRIGSGDNDVNELFYRPGEVRVPVLAPDEPLRAECQHFLRCVRGDGRLRSDADAGLAVVRVLEAADESIHLGSIPIRLQRG